MNFKICTILLTLCVWVSGAYAATVDTIAVFSKGMNKSIPVVVIKPDQGQVNSTLYLLHGYSGDYSNWVNKVAHLKQLVDQYGYLVVCPDGGFDSWYWDTEDPQYKYETFITKELLAHVEQHYAVGSSRTQRAITGLSMGGHGALYLAIKHQDKFAFAGSTSGGVDIRPFPNNWNIKKRIGTYATQADKWKAHTVVEMLHLIEPKQLKLFIDCGTEDFFFGVNEALHKKLSYMNIDHHYLTMPGKHDWNYWSKSIDYQMAFFKSCFQDSAVKK